MEVGDEQNPSCFQRAFNHFRTAIAPHSQTNLATTTHVVASDTHTVVSDVHQGVANTHTIVSELEQNITNTRTMVSDLHRTIVQGQEADDSKNPSRSDDCISIITK